MAIIAPSMMRNAVMMQTTMMVLSLRSSGTTSANKTNITLYMIPRYTTSSTTVYFLFCIFVILQGGRLFD